MSQHSHPQMDVTPPGAQQPERSIDPVLLNALVDVVSNGMVTVLADDASRTVLSETLERVTTATERDRFRAVVTAVRSAGNAAGDERAIVAEVVDAVRDDIAAQDARVTVDHRARLSLDTHEVAVYNFVRTRDPTALSGLSVSAAVERDVKRGAEFVVDGEFAAAADAFVDAANQSGGGNGSILTRSLAAWATHWAGDDEGAIDFVEEALHLHTRAWTPALAGFSADPNPTYSRPQQFRDGKYAAMAVFRYTAACPSDTSVTPFVGIEDDTGTVSEWIELDGTDECTPVDRLGTTTVLRLHVEGTAPAFPSLNGYYVGLGIVDQEVGELREVHRLLLDGPLGESVTERVSVRSED